MGRFFVNHTGKIIGQFTIGQYVGESPKYHYQYEVICTCGTKEIRGIGYLMSLERQGKTVCCKKCLLQYNRQRKQNILPKGKYDLSGQTFDKLTVLGMSHRVSDINDNNKGVWWHVRCSCGSVDVRCGFRLVEAKTKNQFIGCRDCYRKYLETVSKDDERIKILNVNLSIIDGLMLGDGSMTSRTNYNAALKVSQTDKGLTEFIRDKLTPGQPITEIVLSPSRKNIYTFQVSHSALLSVYKRWYPNGKKIVPLDLELSPETVLHWFMGDGSTSYTRNGRGVLFVLSTNGFTEEEVKFLSEKLTHAIGEKANVSTQRPAKKLPDGSLRLEQSNKIYWRITNGGSAFIKAFFNYIGECPVQDMAYKWKIPMCKSICRGEERNKKSNFFGVRPVQSRGRQYWTSIISVRKMNLRAQKTSKDPEVLARWRDNTLIINGLQHQYQLNFPFEKKFQNSFDFAPSLV